MSVEWPTARSGHVSVAIERFLLIWGGYSNPVDPEHGLDIYLPSGEVWLFNSDTHRWVRQNTKGYPPPGLSGAHAVYLSTEKAVYLLCGFMGEGHMNEIYRLNIANWSWTHIKIDDNLSKPSPRDKFGAWEHENSIYIFGGYGPDIIHYMHDAGSYFEDVFSLTSYMKGWNNQLLSFNTQTRSWSNPKCSGCVPSPRAAHGVACVGVDVYLFGGRHEDRRLNDLYSLNLPRLQWTEIKVMGDVPVGRSWHTFTPLSDKRICLYGGYTTDCKTLDDLWYFNAVSSQWAQISLNNRMPRLWHTAVCTSNDDVLVFGGCSNDILSNATTVHTNEILVIRLYPDSLLRLCLDVIYSHKLLLENQWSELPNSLSEILLGRSDLPYVIHLP